MERREKEMHSRGKGAAALALAALLLIGGALPNGTEAISTFSLERDVDQEPDPRRLENPAGLLRPIGTNDG